MLNLSQLIFDSTDVDTLAASANVGAYIRADDGTQISATGTALDVNFTNTSLAVTATDLDIRDLTHASDSVSLGDGTNLYTSTTVSADIGLDVYVLNSDFDVNLQDGAGNDITSTGGALDVNIASGIEIDVEDDKADTALLSTQKDVTTTTGVILASELAARRFLWVQNLGSKHTYIGKSGVTTANGLRLPPGAIAEFRFGPAISLHAVAQAGTQDVRILEAS